MNLTPEQYSYLVKVAATVGRFKVPTLHSPGNRMFIPKKPTTPTLKRTAGDKTLAERLEYLLKRVRQ